MRMLNPSLAVASLLGFLTAASCTLITDVDRTKIPTDAGPGTGGAAGDTGTGGTANEGGTGAMGGSDGGTNNGGRAGRGGNGGTAGTEAGAGGSDAGSGGSGGAPAPTEACDEATGRITLGVGTQISSGWTFALGDGVNNKVTFKFDWDDDSTTESGGTIIHFSGDPEPAQWAVLIKDAINGASNLNITATTTAAGGGNGAGGAGGESGAGANGAGAGGQSGAPDPATPMTETVELVNTLAGARGNVTITETVGNPNFKVSGMSGGNAVVCSAPASCSTDDECDAARTCGSDHVCQ